MSLPLALDERDVFRHLGDPVRNSACHYLIGRWVGSIDSTVGRGLRGLLSRSLLRARRRGFGGTAVNGGRCYGCGGHFEGGMGL